MLTRTDHTLLEASAVAAAIGPTPYIDPLPVPPVIRPRSTVMLRLHNKQLRLHSQLPPSDLWTYGGHVPGPTIEVRKGQRIRVQYRNELSGTLPVTVVEAPYDQAADPNGEHIPQNVPGSNGAPVVPGSERLGPYCVTHLHGGRTEAASDGWPENMVGPGQTQTDTYDIGMRASLYWYHDHGMGVTRLNVYAGLAGLLIVRDDEEDALELPSDQYEIPLLIQDRNFEVTPEQTLTGRLLHKTETQDGPMECFAPYTLVNGALWPYHEVEACHHRLRILNGSNARTYRLVFLVQDDDGTTRQVHLMPGVIRQIGGDGGLFAAPVDLPPEGLTLASAERADLIVDFGALRGKTVTVVNTARAPFPPDAALPDGDRLAGDPAPGTPDPAGRLPRPEVMQFRVAAQAIDDEFVLPPTLSTFRWRPHDQIAHTEHRLVALVEGSVPGKPEKGTVLQLRELQQIMVRDAQGNPDLKAIAARVQELQNRTDPLDPVIEIRDDSGETKFYRVVSALFEDGPNWRVRAGATEVWKILNLTGDTHPFHVHLVQFQPLWRKAYNLGALVAETGITPKAVFDPQTGLPLPGTAIFYDPGADPHPYPDTINRLDENEKGLKDTFRINPGEMAAIALTFDGFCGRYVYHCHILEHEDHDMMRPWLVLPGDILDMMPDMEGGHQHG